MIRMAKNASVSWNFLSFAAFFFDAKYAGKSWIGVCSIGVAGVRAYAL